MHKYLYSIILGILFFLFLNKYDKFNIGIPYSDNSIRDLTLTHDITNYKYCLLSMDGTAFSNGRTDWHYIICIIDFQPPASSEITKVYTLGYGNTPNYGGAYSSPNSYSLNLNLPITSVDNLNQLNQLLFVSWDNLDAVIRRNAEILGWKKSMWDMRIHDNLRWFNESNDVTLGMKVFYQKLLLLNSSLNNENLFNIGIDDIDKIFDLDLSNPDTFPSNSYETFDRNRPNTFNLKWTDLDATQTEAARFFGLTEENWEENKWFINLKSQDFLPKLSKYRKVVDWNNLSEVQFAFLKFLQNNMLKRQSTIIRSMNFCPFNRKIRGDTLITEEDFLDPSNAGFFGEQCTTEGCCLDGAVSFLYDDRLERIMDYMATNNSCSAGPPDSSCNIM